MITGIICEYNPLHNGHKKQLDLLRAGDPDGAIVCLMSGNFVQRGQPAVFDKLTRAKAAVLCGADLVLELPITYALSSAEGFAAGGVGILGKFCDRLCFGAENAQTQALQDIAAALLSPQFSEALAQELEKGLSFPAARQAALDAMGLDGSLIATPNNILAVEYCKAIIAQNSKMQPMPIVRPGDYHDLQADKENPSATAVRLLIKSTHDWKSCIPHEAFPCFENATIHALEKAETAILAKFRTMTDAEFEALPYGSEGLWRKLMHECRRQRDLESILTAVKSKRYTRTRLDRMVMCAFLGITGQTLDSPAPYTRVLAFNDKGRQVLKSARQTGDFINIGQTADHPYEALESRSTSLYGLFAASPEPPDAEENYRIFYESGPYFYTV